MTMKRESSPRPAPQQARWAPHRLYAAVALAEVITWALLITGMIFKYSGVTDVLVSIFGLVHGVAFIAYSLASVFVWVNERWGFGTGALSLVAAVVPFATLPFEKWAWRTGRLSTRWRLTGEDAEAPRNVVERLQAWCLARPLAALALGVVAVAVLTVVALLLGPPVG
ncbi:DUF3817 domain-containing protein [Zhihengliuella flava]|uniref:Integral membrane protein n=1 Tax=Zhihengliuella flava TaxID=1285193 RepID=A0A931D6Q7_9MICC|nr:DUF3817 domain-containing protein [Zhihengliuella flava]MBG6084715.1 integral membrane protein [Zhihengliuella flava]